MLTSAPFDDWWHNAYGLDVKITQPAARAARRRHRGDSGRRDADGARVAEPRRRGSRRAQPPVLCSRAGLLLIYAATIASEHLQRWDMHQAVFYEVAAGVFPFFLVSARARLGRAVAGDDDRARLHGG